jgi:hypothetical protein
VVVLDDDGRLRLSTKPYDTRVAGVVCGAGDFRPGLVLGHTRDSAPRARVALMGRVFCLVDATRRPIRPGDLLTTSAHPGYAMRVGWRRRAAGALLGKSLGGLRDGRGLVPILVALQ